MDNSKDSKTNVPSATILVYVFSLTVGCSVRGKTCDLMKFTLARPAAPAGAMWWFLRS